MRDKDKILLADVINASNILSSATNGSGFIEPSSIDPIKNNMDHRICGKADATLSTIVLGDGSANDLIPKYRSGRFLLGDGTVFQAYYFSEYVEGSPFGMGG